MIAIKQIRIIFIISSFKKKYVSCKSLHSTLSKKMLFQRKKNVMKKTHTTSSNS